MAPGRDKIDGTAQPHTDAVTGTREDQHGKRKDLWRVGGSQWYLHVWLCGGMV